MSQTEYTIWLVPEGASYRKLHDLILYLSQEFTSVPFYPHLTLLGDIILDEQSVISKTTRLAKECSPFRVELGEVGFLDEFYRCLFVGAKKSKELVKLNLKARELFNRMSDPDYFPHVSLLYGNYSEEIKVKIREKIGARINLSFEVNKLLIKKGTIGEKVEYVRRWDIIRTIPFKK